MQWNINGISGINRDQKLTLLKALNADIISLCETHLKNDDNDILNDEFIAYYFSRKNVNVNARRHSGGVAVFVKKNLFSTYHIKVIDKCRDGILALQFTNKLTDYMFVVMSCYLPPDNSVWGNDPVGFFVHILGFLYTWSTVDAVYIMGDFNARIGDKLDYIHGVDNEIPHRVALDKYVNKHGEAFLEFLNESKCCTINGRINNDNDNFTFVDARRGSSVVDYIVVPHDCLINVNYFKVHVGNQLCEELGLQGLQHSDHSLLEFHFSPCHYSNVQDVLRSDTSNMCNVIGEGADLNTIHGSDRNRYYNEPNNLHTPDLNRYYTRFKLNQVPDQFMSNDICRRAITNCIDHILTIRNQQSEIDLAYKQACDVYYTEMNKWLKSKNVNKSAKRRWHHTPKPFWDEHLSHLWHLLCQAESRYLSERNASIRRTLRNTFKNCQNQFDRHYKKKKRKYLRDKCLEIENFNTDDPKEFWRQIKRLGPRNDKDIPLSVRLDDGSISCDIDDVIRKWENDYRNLYNPNTQTVDFDNDFKDEIVQQKHLLETDGPSLYPELNHDISRQEVEKVVNKLKSGKSVGVEGIPYEALKNCLSVNLLQSLFNKVLQSGLVPQLWRCAVIKPIPKASMTDPMIPTQYRGISLLSTIYKVYSGIVNNRLTNVLESNNIYAEEQNGFRPKRSCSEHIYCLTTILRHRIQAKKSTYVCFIDAEKAFDRIDHDMMLFKLLKLGICGNLYRSIQNIYKDCYNCVDLQKDVTNWFPVSAGVRQGDVLSPTLFGIYINDLINEIKDMQVGIQMGENKVSVLAYADDLVVLGESEAELQSILDTVSNWGRKWRMKFNSNKSNVIHFRKMSTPITNVKFSLGGSELKTVTDYKYLGVPLNENLDYSFTASNLASAGGRALGAIVNKYKNLNGLGYYTYSKLYHSCVCPVLDYCSEIWGYKDYGKINSVQNRALRVYLGVHQRTSNLVINGDMGWTPSNTRRYIAMVRFYNRLLAMESNRIPKRIFLWEKELRTHGWAFEIKCLLGKVDQAESYNSNQQCNINGVWSELFSLNSLKWKSDVASSAKLRTFVTYKNEFGVDPFVFKILNRGHRSVLAKFRSGTLPLEIETGRWRGTPVNERLCKICNSGDIEDETHFLFDCTLYSIVRNAFFTKVEEQSPGFSEITKNEKLCLLMSETFVVETSKFLSCCVSLRNEKMYS